LLLFRLPTPGPCSPETPSTSDDITWVVDTGSTHHITYEAGILGKRETLECPLEVGLVGKDTLTITESSSILSELPDGRQLIVENVHYLPTGRINLLSGSLLADNGWTLHLEVGNPRIIGFDTTIPLRYEGGLWFLSMPRTRGHGFKAKDKLRALAPRPTSADGLWGAMQLLWDPSQPLPLPQSPLLLVPPSLKHHPSSLQSKLT
jgi:hypothetical protein